MCGGRVGQLAVVSCHSGQSWATNDGGALITASTFLQISPKIKERKNSNMKVKLRTRNERESQSEAFAFRTE